MRRHRHALTTIFVLAILAVACGGQTGSLDYQEDWGANEVLSQGKMDSLISIAPPIEFDKPVTGFVDSTNLDVYALSLTSGDKIEVTLEVTSGDLNPHLTLFYGTSSHVSSASWSRAGAVLTKDYDTKEYGSGKFLVVVRAYQGQGEGNYALKVSCTGGPCAGEVVESELAAWEASECITKTRQCAFAAIKNGQVPADVAAAVTLFSTCNDKVLFDGSRSCKTACDFDDDAKGLCDQIVKSLFYYGAKPASCITVFETCMNDCFMAGEYGYEYDDDDLDFWYTAESLCFNGGFNGNCDNYAKERVECGGTVKLGIYYDCILGCWTTIGAWIDDLDTMCEDNCSFECPETAAECDTQCAGVGPYSGADCADICKSDCNLH